MLLALCTAITVVILNFHHRGTFGNQVPDLVRLVVLNWLAKLMFLKKRVDRNMSERAKRANNVTKVLCEVIIIY